MESMNRPDAFSVSQVNEYIKMLLEGNPNLNDLWCREKFRAQSSTHRDICTFP